jgi:hypothetical protein
LVGAKRLLIQSIVSYSHVESCAGQGAYRLCYKIMPLLHGSWLQLIANGWGDGWCVYKGFGSPFWLMVDVLDDVQAGQATNMFLFVWLIPFDLWDITITLLPFFFLKNRGESSLCMTVSTDLMPYTFYCIIIFLVDNKGLILKLSKYNP